MGDVAVGGNLIFCLIIVVTFIGLGIAYRFGEWDFDVIKWSVSHKGMGPLLWG